ncbi:MAG: hypothetical protein HQK89_02285 [Nitrospirae bacterium]|nr:hypothetical protein [Nitrospirota bacterium]
MEGEEGVVIRPVEIEIKRKQVIEKLHEHYQELADNPYAGLPEEKVMEILNKARDQYRKEQNAKT